MKPLRVLLIAPECPWPADIGLKTHLWHMIRELAAGAELTVYGFYFSPAERERWLRFAGEQGFSLAGLSPVHSGARLRWEQLRCLCLGRPLAEARYAVAPARDAVAVCIEQAEAAGRAFDWVAYEVFYSLMGAASPSARQPRKLLFPVDCYSLYYGRMHARASTLAEWLRTRYLRWTCARMERRLYPHMNLIATVAEADAAALRGQLPGVRVEVVPVPVPDRPGRRPLGATRRTPRVLVGGYFGMPTVARDTHQFLEAWARQPDRPAAELVVWGRGARQAGLAEVCRRAGAELVEWVEDYDAFLAGADVYVYPQGFACGVQTKIQQAMRAGLAVLASPVVFDPLGVRDGQQGWVIDGPEAAVAGLRQLLGAHQEIDRLGQAAAALMRERFAPELVGRQLRALLAAETAKDSHDSLLSR